ncbi:MAG: hybrid sensor histidine kinase/response regulator [Alphaproteobacteria bacterium]|nr:hybrid sensor histidine kinase/response regulator [Alphaproteobacteria bacterium]
MSATGAPSTRTLHILLMEDNPGDARLTRLLLEEASDFPFNLVHVTSFEQGMSALANGDFDITLVDLSLGDSYGIDTVQSMRQRVPLMPMIVLSGLEDETMAVAALQEGAQDYLVKGQGDGNLIKRSIRYAMERNRVEAQLVETKNAAEAASRAKTEFLANMSHELRTPLNAIIGFSEILKQEPLGPLGHPSYRDYVRDVYESGVHLLHIINDILDLSKIEVGKLTLSETPVDLREAIESCMRIVRERADNGGIALVAELAPDLPTFNADERMVKQVLLNLLSNAIKFTPPGGSVRIIARVDDADGLIVQVVDTGIGIAAADIERALQPFEQIDSSLHRKYQGTGLGLPLARSMSELHGGRFAIESTVGQGTTVTVHFPPERSLRKAPAMGARDVA